MYSVILAALITTGAEQTQAWHCHGCHGCWSACSCSCYGGCYSGYGGYAFWPSCSCYGRCSCCYGSVRLVRLLLLRLLLVLRLAPGWSGPALWTV